MDDDDDELLRKSEEIAKRKMEELAEKRSFEYVISVAVDKREFREDRFKPLYAAVSVLKIKMKEKAPLVVERIDGVNVDLNVDVRKYGNNVKAYKTIRNLITKYVKELRGKNLTYIGENQWKDLCKVSDALRISTSKDLSQLFGNQIYSTDVRSYIYGMADVYRRSREDLWEWSVKEATQKYVFEDFKNPPKKDSADYRSVTIAYQYAVVKKTWVMFE